MVREDDSLKAGEIWQSKQFAALAAIVRAHQERPTRAQVENERDTGPRRPTDVGRAYIDGWNAAIDAVLAFYDHAEPTAPRPEGETPCP